jgi:hypothetical protein
MNLELAALPMGNQPLRRLVPAVMLCARFPVGSARGRFLSNGQRSTNPFRSNL